MTRAGVIFLQACIKGGNACEWVEDKSLNILWHFTRCVLILVEIIHMSKFKLGTVSSILRQKSSLRLCDAGAMLEPLNYGGS